MPTTKETSAQLRADLIEADRLLVQAAYLVRMRNPPRRSADVTKIDELAIDAGHEIACALKNVREMIGSLPR